METLGYYHNQFKPSHYKLKLKPVKIPTIVKDIMFCITWMVFICLTLIVFIAGIIGFATLISY